MTEGSRTRIQLCGRLVVQFDGRRLEHILPGHKGRMLFAYLVLTRSRPVGRDELVTALWGEDRVESSDPSLSVLLSKLRRAVGPDRISGRHELEIVLPPRAFVDVEAAVEAVHRAESHVAQKEWAEAWGPAGIAYHVATRVFLTGFEMPWIDDWRRRLDDIRLRGLECFAASALGLGAYAAAEQYARQLTELTPYRENAHRILMEALEGRGNVAEGLLAYDKLRRRLRDDLGVAPSPTVQAVHRRLLGASES